MSIQQQATVYLFIDGPKVMPITHEILKISGDASKHDAETPKPEKVDKLFKEWNKYNFGKILIALFTWSLGVAALLLA